jgi:hypothetical protein
MENDSSKKIYIENSSINPYMFMALIYKFQNNPNYQYRHKIIIEQISKEIDKYLTAEFWKKIEFIEFKINKLKNKIDIYNKRNEDICTPDRLITFILNNTEIKDKVDSFELILKDTQHIVGELNKEIYEKMVNCQKYDKYTRIYNINCYEWKEIILSIIFIFIILAIGIIIPYFFKSTLFLSPTMLLIIGQFLGFIALDSTIIKIKYEEPNILQNKEIPYYIYEYYKMKIGAEWYDIDSKRDENAYVVLDGNAHRWLTSKFNYKYNLKSQWLSMFSIIIVGIGYIGTAVIIQITDSLLWLIIAVGLILIRHILLGIIPVNFLCINYTRLANCKLIIENCISGIIINTNTQN